jgi:hypothetical protein
VDLAEGRFAKDRLRYENPRLSSPDAVVDIVASIAEHFADDTGDSPIGVTLPTVVTERLVRTAAQHRPAWLACNTAACITLQPLTDECPSGPVGSRIRGRFGRQIANVARFLALDRGDLVRSLCRGERDVSMTNSHSPDAEYHAKSGFLGRIERTQTILEGTG